MGVVERTRNSDPVTSAEAAAGVDLGASQWQVLALFSIAGKSLTDAELERVAIEYGSEYSSSRLRSARKELCRLGMIREVDGVFRPGRTKKRRAQVWALVTPEK